MQESQPKCSYTVCTHACAWLPGMVNRSYKLSRLLLPDTGGIVVLVAALEHKRDIAEQAGGALSSLLRIQLPQEQQSQAEAVIVRMQGIRRFSSLLCPIYCSGQESLTVWGMPSHCRSCCCKTCHVT